MHGTRIRLWGIDARKSSQLCPGEDSLRYRCGAKAANGLDTFIAGRPVSCIPISLEQYRRTVATCSVGGTDLAECLSARVSRWTGRSIRRASSIRSTVKPSTPGAACGQAATSSRGYIVRASGRAEHRPTAPTMRTLILRTSACVISTATTINQAAIYCAFRGSQLAWIIRVARSARRSRLHHRSRRTRSYHRAKPDPKCCRDLPRTERLCARVSACGRGVRVFCSVIRREPPYGSSRAPAGRTDLHSLSRIVWRSRAVCLCSWCERRNRRQPSRPRDHRGLVCLLDQRSSIAWETMAL
jgi:hypothetical protein